MADDVPVKEPQERSQVRRPLEEITKTDEEGNRLLFLCRETDCNLVKNKDSAPLTKLVFILLSEWKAFFAG